MLEDTISRISHLIKRQNIYIATNKIYSRKIKGYIKRYGIPLKNVLFEPEGKNTLAPVALLSKRIRAADPEAIIVALPCDHSVKPEKRFLKLLNRAIDVAGKGYIVALGVRPNRSEAGYGYIRIKSKLKIQNSNVYKVNKFIEKPTLLKANKFLKDKRYFWNSGVFIFKADVMLREINRFMPYAHKIMISIKGEKSLNRLWSKLPSLSIDYAVMEKTKRMVLLPLFCDWLDLGSWQALAEIMKKDKNGNIFRGTCVDIGSKNSFVWSDSRLIATLGLSNIIVMDTKDALLVCPKDKAQEIKSVVQILKQRYLD